MHQCHCDHHSPSQLPVENKRVNHVVDLLRNNFISPYKVLFMLDPKQADHFKLRNEKSGCCSSNHITISDNDLTKTQKYLKELISYSSLIINLDNFLKDCKERYSKIIESGKRDKLEVTTEVEKFILDKVMSESINNTLLAKLSRRIKEESLSNNRQIGLWATPATWYQRYPNASLNYFSGQFLSSLLREGWAVMSEYVPNQKELFRQLSILQKDGKFEQSKWLQNQKAKILNNIEKFIQIKTSNNDYLFEQIRELTIKLSSIPFELNAKANLFCTVSPNLHVLYSKGELQTTNAKGQLRYTVIVNGGNKVKMTLSQHDIILQSSSILIFDNNKATYSIKNEESQLYLLVNYIGCVEKK